LFENKKKGNPMKNIFVTLLLILSGSMLRAETILDTKMDEELKVTLLANQTTRTIGKCEFGLTDDKVSLHTPAFNFYLAFGTVERRVLIAGEITITSELPSKIKRIVKLKATPPNAKLFTEVEILDYRWAKVNDGNATDPVFRDGWALTGTRTCK
jgi:hypothetical protein